MFDLPLFLRLRLSVQDEGEVDVAVCRPRCPSGLAHRHVLEYNKAVPSMFAVSPLSSCAHWEALSGSRPGWDPAAVAAELAVAMETKTCKVCSDGGIDAETWICLLCREAYCSRYRNRHMQEHFAGGTCGLLCVSSRDLSVWCNVCESYIFNEQLRGIVATLHGALYGVLSPTPRETLADNIRRVEDTLRSPASSTGLCTICQEPCGLGRGGALPCGHCFHVDCFVSWLAASPLGVRCPVCQQEQSIL